MWRLTGSAIIGCDVHVPRASGNDKSLATARVQVLVAGQDAPDAPAVCACDRLPYTLPTDCRARGRRPFDTRYDTRRPRIATDWH